MYFHGVAEGFPGQALVLGVFGIVHVEGAFIANAGATKVLGEFPCLRGNTLRAREGAGLAAQRQEATSASPGAVSPLPAGTAGPLDPTP